VTGAVKLWSPAYLLALGRAKYADAVMTILPSVSVSPSTRLPLPGATTSCIVEGEDYAGHPLVADTAAAYNALQSCCWYPLPPSGAAEE